MFTVIGIMFAGIAAGYLLRKIEFLQKIGQTYFLYDPFASFPFGNICRCE